MSGMWASGFEAGTRLEAWVSLSDAAVQGSAAAVTIIISIEDSNYHQYFVGAQPYSTGIGSCCEKIGVSYEIFCF